MSSEEQGRVSAVVCLERVACASRYIAYAVLVSLFLLGQIEGTYTDLAVVTAVIALHHVFVHGVLWTRRYHLFRTRLNFFIYLVETSLIVFFTGGDESDLYLLYFFVLLGYSVYSARYRTILLASGACSLGYAIVIVAEWVLSGLAVVPGIIAGRFMFILIGGWLVATIGHLLRNAEEASQNRALDLASCEVALATILETTVNAIFVYDNNGFISKVNNRACDFLGLPREHIVGRRLRTFLRDSAALEDRLTQAGANDAERVFVDAERRERSAELHVRSFVRGGQPFYIGIARDITEQKGLQEAARQASEDLARANRELRRVSTMRADLVRANAQRISSPLTAILGYLDMLLGEELGELLPEQRKALQTCRRSTTRVFALVDEIFAAHAADLKQQ